MPVQSNAEDLHLPSCWIVESGSPACAAAVAAPIRKLWPLNRPTSTPADLSASRTAATSTCLLRGCPDWSRNSGPGDGGRRARYVRREDTGHSDLQCAPGELILQHQKCPSYSGTESDVPLRDPLYYWTPHPIGTILSGSSSARSCM